MKSIAIGLITLLVCFNVEAQQKQKTTPSKTNSVKPNATRKTPVPEPVEGFWLVTKVTVGTKELTPIARWFKLGGGKQVSGNGWLQHSFGTYKYDQKKSELFFTTENEPDDEFGAFKVLRTGPLMSWTRKEDGETVVVEMKPITEMPKSPADEAKGLWVLETALDREIDITKKYNPDRDHFLFIRWDRQYVKQINSRERVSGYWFFDANEPVITLISEHREHDDEKWSMLTDGKKLVLKGVSENVKGLVLTYKLATDFPK